jgi:eukaryotic-like serine/threonine-protein kinase
MTLVLVIVALLSGLITMRLAVHGREVQVPNLVGKTPAEARRLSEAEGLTATVAREYYSSLVPEGRVLSQVPAAGTVVRGGWELRLAISLGPQSVVIPQVVGQSGRTANIILQQRGLQLSSVATMDMPNSTAGQVLGQDPPANAQDVEAPKLSYLVSDGPPPQAFVMPSFVGQTLASVTIAVNNAGLTLGKVVEQPVVIPAPPPPAQQPVPQAATSPTATNPSPPPAPVPVTPGPASIVVSQDPAPGQKVLQTAAVNLVVR